MSVLEELILIMGLIYIVFAIQAEVLTGVPVPDITAAYNAIDLLQSFQPGSIVLTLGEKGLLFSEREKQSGKWSRVEHIEAEKVEAIDTTVSTCSECCMHESSSLA